MHGAFHHLPHIWRQLQVPALLPTEEGGLPGNFCLRAGEQGAGHTGSFLSADQARALQKTAALPPSRQGQAPHARHCSLARSALAAGGLSLWLKTDSGPSTNQTDLRSPGKATLPLPGLVSSSAQWSNNRDFKASLRRLQSVPACLGLDVPEWVRHRRTR